jgi:hypothetical protein
MAHPAAAPISSWCRRTGSAAALLRGADTQLYLAKQTERHQARAAELDSL